LTDEVLRIRLQEVKKTLERAALVRICPDQPAEAEDPVDPDGFTNAVALRLPILEQRIIKPVWMPLELQFRQESNLLIQDLEDVDRRLGELEAVADPEAATAELANLWADYADLERKSEVLLGEIVELLGGLSFRDRSEDPWFFAMADQMVQWYAGQTGDPWDPLTVPFIRHAAARALARVVGLRFPDWTLWALPLIGYDFAYQYFRRGDKAENILGMIERRGVDIKGMEETRSRSLLAHAFAAFTTGPAYAFAALYLRLSPESAEAALVITGTLEQLAGAGQFKPDFLDAFREQWDHSPVSRQEIDPEREKQLKAFSAAAFRALRDSLRDSYSEEDWVRARSVAQGWELAARVGRPLKQSEVPRLRLVDVLNAAWYSRFKREVEPERLERAARKECERIAGGMTAQPHLQGAPGQKRVRP
jgi:hypothetical protein